MPATTLASTEDVEAFLGRSLSSADERKRVTAILEKASALFRWQARQQFTPGESISRLKVNGGRVRVPEHPIGEIRSVRDDQGAAVEYSRAGQWLTVCLGSHEFVTVDYTHGADEVPELVRTTVAEIAKKVLSIDPRAAAGVSQGSTTTGPFTDSNTYATWAQGGQTMLAPDDLAIAKSFRPRVPKIWVTHSSPPTESRLI